MIIIKTIASTLNFPAKSSPAVALLEHKRVYVFKTDSWCFQSVIFAAISDKLLKVSKTNVLVILRF